MSKQVMVELETKENSAALRSSGMLERRSMSVPSPFVALAATVFSGGLSAKRVALVSSFQGEGVTETAHSLGSFLANELDALATVVEADQYLRYLNRHMHERSDCSGKEPRFTLVDCPAVTTSASLLRVAPHVDGFLIVVKAGARTKQEVIRTMKIIEAAKGQIFGAVLTDRTYPIPRWIYRLIS